MAQMRASHILVDSQDLAEELKAKIETGTPFEEMAQKHSSCPSGKGGGDLGWFEEGMMVKPFEDACLSLQSGQISGPVKTQFGYHLIKMTGKK